MNLVDLVVVVVVLLAAIQGLRLGAIVQVLSFGGFLVGLYLGALLASETVRWVHSQPARTAVALLTMLGIAAFCGLAGRVVGSLAFRRIHRGILGPVDSALGVVVAIAASLLVAWLLASTLVNSSSLSLNTAIDQSTILKSLDNVLPAPPSVFSRVQSFLSAEGFPPVFAQLAPASAGPVSLPGDAQLQEAVAHAGASTVKVIGDGCGQIQEGSGFVVGAGLVVTNAHVIAGIPHPVVEVGNNLFQTTVLSFDPSFDLAVMRVRGVNEPPLALDPDKSTRGVQAAVLGYPGGGPFKVAAGRGHGRVRSRRSGHLRPGTDRAGRLRDPGHRPPRQLRWPPGPAGRTGDRRRVLPIDHRRRHRLRPCLSRGADPGDQGRGPVPRRQHGPLHLRLSRPQPDGPAPGHRAVRDGATGGAAVESSTGGRASG